MDVRLSAEVPAKQLEWRNNPQIFKWTRQNGILTLGEHLSWLNGLPNRKDVRMFGIEADVPNPATRQAGWHECGTCGLTSINQTHGTAEFSLFIAPEFQGQGIGKAALTALLETAFGAMNLKTVWGETFVGNPALKLFLKLGMKEEGVLRSRYEKDNVRIDAIPISITREEWYASRS